MKNGRLIALVGVTSVGKTTQREKLVAYGREELKFSVTSVKYPVYNLSPTGPLIHACLKEGNSQKWTAEQLQEACAQNRHDFQPKLEQLLTENDFVILEMYTTTGFCFGMGDGVPWPMLKKWNEGLTEPDVTIWLDGARFMDSIEKGHRFEEDAVKTEVIRNFHFLLCEKYGWHTVISSSPKEVVFSDILTVLERYAGFKETVS